MEESLKQKFLPDEYIFRQGDKGTDAYLLLDGRIAVEVDGKKIAEISEMEIFGEMSLILSKPRAASIKVMKPSIVLPISPSVLEELLEKSPPFISALVRELSYRLAVCDSEIHKLRKIKDLS